MKIFLIGMPGSGKSTLGHQLAMILQLPFIDLDVEIEAQEGKRITEIFSESGEDYFRQAESIALKKLTKSAQSFVLATGGGAPCFHDGIKIINEAGVSIFFDVPVTELVARVENNKDRPLLIASDKDALTDRLEGLRSKRLAFYTQAHITTADFNIESILEKLTQIKT